ncbi:RrF2 family transcriptional regulator [Desulfovibrio sp.]
MHLSTRSRYGVRIVLDVALHQADGPVKVSDIALRQSISHKYLEKIIISLRQANILRSVRGCRGGILLARPKDEITAGELVRVLEGKKALTDCANPDTRCVPCQRTQGCPAQRLWFEASRALPDTLDNITMADVIAWQGEMQEDSAAFCRLPRCLDQAGEPRVSLSF